MRTLDEYNQDRRLFYAQHQLAAPRANGIACPKCGNELYDTNPYTTLTSSPPQKEVHCSCGYTGYRVA